MTEFKKTKPQGTPGAAVYPILTPKGASESRDSVSSNADEPPSAEPSSSSREDPGASNLPPEPTPDELLQTRPPEGSRTPPATRTSPNFGPALPDSAPGWMLRARRMSLGLEEAIAAGSVDPTQEACIERAFAAWELEEARDKRIAHVARLVERAHTVLRETAPADIDRVLNECALVLRAGLPRKAKARQDFADVMFVVRALRADADPWAAVVSATANLLGWTGAARAHAAQAVRVALLGEPANK